MDLTKRIWVLLAAVALAGGAWAQTRTVRNVSVEGLKNINEVAIKAVMRLKPGQPVDQASIVRDEEDIRALGFFSKVEILRRDITDTDTDLTVLVKEFPVIKEIRIEGNTVVPDSQILPLFDTEEVIGNIWNNNKAQGLTNAIKKIYTDKGYLINFEQFGPIEESEGTLTVKILETVLGNVKLEGLTRTRPETIQRMMKSKPGAPLNMKTIQNDIENLYFTYWFDDIKGGQSVGDRPEVVDITLNFKEARTAQINAGVALDPQSRLVGTASYTESNFRGMGQTVGAEFEMATVGGGLSAQFVFGNRFYDRKDTAMQFKIFSTVQYNFTGNGFVGSGSSADSQFDERQTGFSLNFNRPYGERYRANVGLTARNNRTINLTSTTTGDIVQQDGDLVTLQIGGTYSTAQPYAEPVQGDTIQLLLEPGYSNITKIGGNVAKFSDTLGKSTFLRSTLTVKKYWSKSPTLAPDETPEIGLAKPRPVLAFKFELGHLSGTVPFFEQLFVGGASSLRGYPNQRFWGSTSMLTTLEYRYPIQKSFNIIGFTDWGGAWGGYGVINNFEQSDSPRLHFGYGVGLGFRVPGLGSIRVDLAFDEKGSNRTHFTVGSSF
ncbi:MAG: BamA/TamA family outer membrane protein [Armatimonadetes bacterium]|nr:BamA/TamA family outer membrane protein [Armatimonadota bacterium]MBX3108270.1 BamA/TamA family outer membrane protein [Fimbriimonadaceae bacterium]